MPPEGNQNRDSFFWRKIFLLACFGIAMGYFEAAVVVYLRELFYPGGFSFPLQAITLHLIVIELFRELATMIMIAAVAALAGRKFWEWFGYFIIIFGIWDIFYYVWLKVTIGWPASLLDWDILFLVPLPWIGPVIAPLLISILMIAGGIAIARRYAGGSIFRLTLWSWVLWIIATGVILSSFMYDTDATIHFQMPRPYLYSLLIVGLVLYIAGFILSCQKANDELKSG